MNIVHAFDSIWVFVGAAALLAVSMVVLLVMQIKNSRAISKLSHPVEEVTVKKAHNTANEILAKAHAEAQEIVTHAEAESRTILKERGEEGSAALEGYLHSLEELKTHLNAQLEKSATEVEAQSVQIAQSFSDNLEVRDQDMQEAMEMLTRRLSEIPDSFMAEAHAASTELRTQVEEAGEMLQRELQSMQGKSQEHIQNYLQKKFTEAEADIAAYRESRKALIDSHMEALVLDVVRVTLNKELSKDDHAQLVREALEEAKGAGVL